MNPIDSYRDTALDGLVGQQPAPEAVPSSSRSRSSRHSRQASMQTRESLPPTSSRGQPIVYPGTETAEPGVQRSFSQRARGRPFADEAYANDSLADSTLPVPAPAPAPAPLGKGARDSIPSQEPVSQPASVADPVFPAVDRQSSRRQQIIQDNIRSAADAASSNRQSRDRRSDPIPEPLDAGTGVAGLSRAPTTGDATSQEQREWAPDRSPLQKLEVTLNDISKEEKRARVQEAEMLHREKTRSQKPSVRADPTSSRIQSGPSTIEDAGVVRSLSNTHKDRLQHSTVIESRKPDPTSLASSSPGFNYSSAFPPSRSVTITRRSRQGVGLNPNPDTQRASSSYVPPPPADMQVPSVQTRSVSASHPQTSIVPDTGLSSQDSRSARSRQILDTDRIPTSQERNASHRAALERLTGSSGTRNKPETQLRQPEDVSGNLVQPSSVGGLPSSRLVNNNQISYRNATPQGQSIPVSLGVQGSPGLRSVDSPAPADGAILPTQRQKRRSSVSFKEPYEKRRPVDEWKAAETARLTATDFLLEPETDQNRNKAWWEDDPKTRRRSNRQQAAPPSANAVIDDRIAEFRPKLLLKCGPLLRYTGMKRTVGTDAQEYWRGTLMIVTQDSQSSYEKSPTLRLYSQPKTLYIRPEAEPEPEHDDDADRPYEDHDPLVGTTKLSRIGRALYIKPAMSLPLRQDISKIETDDGLFESSPPITNTGEQAVSVAPVASRIGAENGEKFGRYKEIKGVRLYADPDRDATFWLFKLEIQLGAEQQHIGYRINSGAASGFWVPAAGQTMNMMFHSCNGFSMSVKTDDFSGPDPLWRDVLSAHQSRPFHVMIGGGDQIYNDKVMRDTHYFGEWTANKNPHYKHNAAFTSEMKEELETFYLENYCSWFSQGLFGAAAAQIPMVNMWDDHDIIDGFGSYPHHFMLSPVFSGLGNVAFKYYMLFQQHSVDSMTHAEEPSWILGYKPGPYINKLSRSIFLDLGKHVALLALDCRTERTKSQVLSLKSFDLALDRCRKEIIEGVTKHLIVLLGVPIAYPRMNWLENVLTSRAMDPVKALGRYGVIKGGFLNRFDGGVEVLDDLDDHWTAHHHKKERNEFIRDLQDLAAERSVRITILGGDVHLAAIGQFYSNPKLKIPKDRDHRYMPNVVSSAIVNTPPPEMLADVLNKRNKIHHLDSYTDESMIPMFTHDTDYKKRNNKYLLPRRNWCSITEYIPGRTPPSSRSTSPSRSPSPELDQYAGSNQPKRSSSMTRSDLNPRTLFRRLSSRKGRGPPTAYRDEYDNPNSEPRAASFDEVRTGRGGPTSWNERSDPTRRTASETRDINLQQERTSEEITTGRKPPPFRPGFHRRPTNLSEKAAKKGNIPAIDAEGNEFDVNDHVNLDGGLDIVLNCEIERGDPRGHTLPYRLLVPALWYDGSSDREKLDDAEGLQRKPTLMNKIGFGGKRGYGAGQNQGAGEWGQESDTESFSESDHEVREERPRKSLGLFSSFRKKRPVDDEQYDRDGQDHYGAAAGVVPETQAYNASAEVPGRSSFHEQVTGPGTTTTPKTTPPRTGYQASPEGPYDSRGISALNEPSFNRPPTQAAAPPKRSSSFKATNLLRKNSSKKQPPTSNNFAAGPVAATYHQPEIQPSRQAPAHPYASTDPVLGVERANSYTIGTHRGSGSQLPHPVAANPPYDEDSAYLSTQRRGVSRAVSNPASTAPSAYRAQKENDLKRNSSLRSTNTGNIQQDPVIGIGTDRDAFSGNPQQRTLRGNGILGRLGLGKQSASADRVPQTQSRSDQTPLQGQDEFGAPNRPISQGYTGIEAYREKPKRGLSLRDRARNFMDKVDGRRRNNDDGYDDDDYSYHSSDSYSSENLGETPADGTHQSHRDTQRTLPQNSTMSNHGNDDEYSDERSFMSGEPGEPLPPEKPKRGLSQRLKMGFGKMGSSSKRDRDRDYDREYDRNYDREYEREGVNYRNDSKYY